MQNLSDIAVIALGGTIAMTPGGGGGVVPKLTADDLVAAVPGLADVARIHASTFRQVPGAHLDLHDAVELAGEIERTLETCAGVVVTQGTDTIDEMAYALDLLVRSPRPVVVTGAMRNPTVAGADGPANLLAAVQTAASAAAVGLGCLVVLNDEIHAARLVVKGHTARPDAFVSPLGGPLGYVAEGLPRVLLRPVSAPVALPADVAPRPVGLVTAVLGDDGSALRFAAQRSEGVVVEAMGGGHVPPGVADAIGDVAPTLPVRPGLAHARRRDPAQHVRVPGVGTRPAGPRRGQRGVAERAQGAGAALAPARRRAAGRRARPLGRLPRNGHSTRPKPDRFCSPGSRIAPRWLSAPWSLRSTSSRRRCSIA